MIEKGMPRLLLQTFDLGEGEETFVLCDSEHGGAQRGDDLSAAARDRADEHGVAQGGGDDLPAAARDRVDEEWPLPHAASAGEPPPRGASGGGRVRNTNRASVGHNRDTKGASGGHARNPTLREPLSAKRAAAEAVLFPTLAAATEEQASQEQASGSAQTLASLPAASDDDSEILCRVCYEPAEPGTKLLSPCDCSGSMQYIHKSCLDDCIQYSKSKQQEACDDTPPSCDLCQAPYNFNNWATQNETRGSKSGISNTSKPDKFKKKEKTKNKAKKKIPSRTVGSGFGALGDASDSDEEGEEVRVTLEPRLAQQQPCPPPPRPPARPQSQSQTQSQQRLQLQAQAQAGAPQAPPPPQLQPQPQVQRTHPVTAQQPQQQVPPQRPQQEPPRPPPPPQQQQQQQNQALTSHGLQAEPTVRSTNRKTSTLTQPATGVTPTPSNEGPMLKQLLDAYSLGHLWPKMKEEGMDLESFCLLDEEDEEELEEVGVGEKDLVAFRGLLRIIRMSQNIS